VFNSEKPQYKLFRTNIRILLTRIFHVQRHERFALTDNSRIHIVKYFTFYHRGRIVIAVEILCHANLPPLQISGLLVA